MYLEHFNLKEMPFALTANTEFFCRLPGHQSALNVVLVSLRNGEGFIKVVGEVGTGKTLLCRLLLERLGDDFITAYVPNPDLNPAGLRVALAQELGLAAPYPRSQHALLELITNKLIEVHATGKRVVLLMDEAQAMTTESLEALRLLTNLETNTFKLLQVVLFGQPELDVRLNQANLRQLKQRITFSHYLNPLNRTELEDYLCHRLAKAGHTLGPLFTRKAADLLYRKTKGIPRLINILCHKAMMIAYGRGETRVEHKAVNMAVRDTESVAAPFYQLLKLAIVIPAVLVVSIIILIIKYHHLL